MRVLLLDEDLGTSREVRAALDDGSLDLSVVRDSRSGLARYMERRPELVLLDTQLPGRDIMDVLRELQANDSGAAIILLAHQSDLRTAMRAKLNGIDFVLKPLDAEELQVMVRRAVELAAAKSTREKTGDPILAAQLGPSVQAKEIITRVAAVAGSEFTVLVTGETGTGKEVVSQAIHRQSARARSPLVAVDCGAIPEALLESELFGHEKGAFSGALARRAGQFELAQGGTLLLDEIGNLPLALQAKLLRVLGERQVRPVGSTEPQAIDVRVIAATNEDLHNRVRTGAFRADLYYRLAQYTIELPPLRQRVGDIAHLSARFLGEVTDELRRPIERLTPAAVAVLEAHSWPGNVRELRNVIRKAAIETTTREIDEDAIARALARPVSRSVPVVSPLVTTWPVSLRDAADAAAREAERQLITSALRYTQGNKSHAARLLQTDYKTLHLKMRQLGIEARDFSH